MSKTRKERLDWLNEQIEMYRDSEDGEPCGIFSSLGAFAVIYEDGNPKDVYALIPPGERTGAASIPEALAIIDYSLWLDGVDVQGYTSICSCQSFAPKIRVDPNLVNDAWPQDVVDLLQLVWDDTKPYEYYFLVHVFDIGFSH